MQNHHIKHNTHNNPTKKKKRKNIKKLLLCYVLFVMTVLASEITWTLKAPITSAAEDKFCDIYQQTSLMKYNALFSSFEKKKEKKIAKFWNGRLLQIIGGALWVNHWYKDKRMTALGYC